MEILYIQDLLFPLDLMNLENTGMIFGEIDNLTKKLETSFIGIDEKEFVEQELDITEVLSQEDLIQKIENLEIPDNKYVKIVLVGNRKIEIEKSKILKELSNSNIIKISDKTTLEVNLEEIAKKDNLKGIFVKTLLEKKEEEPENKEKIERAIEIGLSCFD